MTAVTHTTYSSLNSGERVFTRKMYFYEQFDNFIGDLRKTDRYSADMIEYSVVKTATKNEQD